MKLELLKKIFPDQDESIFFQRVTRWKSSPTDWISYVVKEASENGQTVFVELLYQKELVVSRHYSPKADLMIYPSGVVMATEEAAEILDCQYWERTCCHPT